MQCPRCLAQNREGRRFCAECGAKLALPCSSCGFANEPGEKYCGGCGLTLTPGNRLPTSTSRAPHTYTPSYLADKILTLKSAVEGERKQVTVLFADLKDSTEIIRGLDPEAAQRLLDPALHRMMDAVHRFEGTVNQVLGDGIMALFGAPIAHEDYALRTCYAALAMQAAMRAYTEEVRRAHGLEMRMRVGLNSGEVVVRAIGNDLHMDYSAVGETTHLAARMEQLATPGTIRLTAATLRLVDETRLFPEQEYTFKHALTYEVAYGSLLQERRQMLHARIAEALEKLSTDRLTEQVDGLAHHTFRGAVWDKAVAFCRQAGAKAMVHSAHHQAVAYWKQALEALKHLAATRDLQEQAIDLRFSLRNALIFLGDYDRSFTHLRQAEALAEGLADQRRLGLVYSNLTNYFDNTGQPDTAIEYGQHALTLATSLDDFALQVHTRYLLPWAHYQVGEYHRAIDLCKRNVTALQGGLCRERLLGSGLPSAGASACLAVCLAEVGAFSEGNAYGYDAIQLAEEDQRPITLIRAYFGVGYLRVRQGEFRQAIPVLERGLACCQAGEVPMWLPSMATALGTSYAVTGRIADALALLEDAVEQFTSMRLLGLLGYPMLTLNEVYLLADRLEDATSLAERTLTYARNHKKRGIEAYVLRLLGEIAAHYNPPEAEKAGSHYHQSLAMSEDLGMRPLQAYCHFGLGSLYAGIGRHEQASCELSAAIDLYRAMEMTFWLPQAEAALAAAK